MASAELSRRVQKVVGHPPLAEMDDLQRRGFHEALLAAGESAAATSRSATARSGRI
jgi:hypothetical protein